MSNNRHQRHPSDPVMCWLRRQAWAAERRHNGFMFALRCEANLDQLRAELRECQEDLATHTDGSMAPTSGPRIHREGYVAALEETIAFIESAPTPAA